MKSDLEELFMAQILDLGLPVPQREYKFHDRRRWKFDMAWPVFKMAVEIEGGTWMAKGRHTTGAGFAKDCEKYNWAARLGWRVFRFTGKEVKNNTAINWMVAQFQAEAIEGMIIG